MMKLIRHLPNFLTAGRLCAAPLTAYLILKGHDAAALGVFAFAGLSDALDGYLARRFAYATRFGAYLDPAADKILMLASFVTLTMIHAVPFWLTALVIARDLAIVLGVGVAWLFSLPLKIEPLLYRQGQHGDPGGLYRPCAAAPGSECGSAGIGHGGDDRAASVTAASWLVYGQLLVRALALGRRPA